MNAQPIERELSIDVGKVSSELRIRPEVYVRIVRSFADNLGGKMHDLDEALSGNDVSRMRSILHEVKGTASNLRLRTISEPEEIMHAAVTAGDDSHKLSGYLEDLKSETRRLQGYVKDLEIPS